MERVAISAYPRARCFQTFRQFQKTLGRLDTWLEKADAYARARPFDPKRIGSMSASSRAFDT